MRSTHVTYWQLTWRTAAMVFTAVVLPCIASGADLFTVPLIPNSYDEVEQYIQTDIPENLESAMCGGYDASQFVGSTVGQGVASVTGLPGRKIKDGNPLNTIELGMPIKDDAFYFPDVPTTCGFVSACLPHFPGSPTDSNDQNSRFYPPFYGNNVYNQACERPLDGFRPDDFPDPDRRVTYSCGGGEMKKISSDTNFCPTLLQNNPSFANIAAGTTRTPTSPGAALTKETAGGICQRLNEDWIYSFWKKPTKDAAGAITGYDYIKKNCTTFDDPSIKEKPADGYELDSYRYCCTDAKLGSANKNCVACVGAECHQGKTATIVWSPNGNGSNGQISWHWDLDPAGTEGLSYPVSYYSYFRHYLGTASRSKIVTGAVDAGLQSATVEPSVDGITASTFDKNTLSNIPVSCYGFWDWSADGKRNYETIFNPATVYLPGSVLRCVFGVYYEKSSPLGGKNFFWQDQNNLEQMRATQSGRGAYKLWNWKTNAPYKDPAVDDPNRTNTDVWIRDLARGFSLLKDSIFEKDGKKIYDISEYLLGVDAVVQRTTVQRYPVNTAVKNDLFDTLPYQDAMKTIQEIQLSQGGTMRAFDDTVATTNLRRTLIEWWQKIENSMSHYFTPPTVQLILPPAWSIDLDPLHPIFNPIIPKVETGAWRANPVYQPIEVQLQLREDMLGEVAAYLEDSLLIHYTPQPITVLVPTGSANEFRTLAQGWCQWYLQANNKKSCDEVQGIAKQMMDRLLEYAKRIDDGRVLRTQAEIITAEFLSVHTDIQKKIGQWVIDNTADYLAWQDAWQERLQVVPIWQDIQKAHREFDEITNAPWCMNQRFTAPIYSFIDSWFGIGSTPGKYNLYAKDLSGPLLPTLPVIKTQTGITFDISSVYIGTGTVTIPQIEPLPLKMQIANLTAPGLDIKELPSTIVVPPALPEIPDFTDDFHAYVRKTLSGSLAPLFSTHFTLDTFPEVQTKLPEIKKVIVGMNASYKRFWDSIMIDPKDVIDGTEEDCYEPNKDRCIHAEFDLHERLMRMASRPAVFLKEDFESHGAFRTPPHTAVLACTDPAYTEYKDWVCLDTAPYEVLPREGFKIYVVLNKEQTRLFNALRIKQWKDMVLQGGIPAERRIQYSTEHDQITPSFTIDALSPIISTDADASSSSSSSRGP